MSVPWALAVDRVTLSTVRPTESKTPIASRTDQSTKTATTATTAIAMDSRNDSFITAHGSARPGTGRARRALTRVTGRLVALCLIVSVTGDMVEVGWLPRHSRAG